MHDSEPVTVDQAAQRLSDSLKGLAEDQDASHDLQEKAKAMRRGVGAMMKARRKNPASDASSSELSEEESRQFREAMSEADRAGSPDVQLKALAPAVDIVTDSK